MIRSIQYLRALAATMVVIEHTQQQVVRHGRGDLGFEFSIGPAGVDIFFVISGFIMYVITRDRNPRPVDFWAKRIIRIAPCYWLYMSMFLMIYLVNSDLLHGFVYDAGHVLASYLYLPAYHPKFREYIWPVLPLGWTLNYEMYFYFLFGLGLYFSKRSGRNPIVFYLIGALALGLALRPDAATLNVYTNPLLLEFLAGIAIGRVFVSDMRVSRSVSLALIGLSLILFGVAWVVGGVDNSGNWLRVLQWGTPGMCLVAGFVLLEKNHGMLHSPTLHTIGDASYSIYLTHYFTVVPTAILWNKLGLTEHLPDLLLLLLGVCMSLFCGWLAYILVEKRLTTTFTRVYCQLSPARSST